MRENMRHGLTVFVESVGSAHGKLHQGWDRPSVAVTVQNANLSRKINHLFTFVWLQGHFDELCESVILEVFSTAAKKTYM